MDLSVKFRIGVTGSRHGWTGYQIARFQELLEQIPYTPENVEAHHGCCVGGDEIAHIIFKKRGFQVVGHPPINTSWLMAQDLINELDTVHTPKDYNDRNLDIVLSSDLLFAGPKLPRYRNRRKQKSGTWNTIDMGIKNGILVEVVMPLPWEKAKPEVSPFFDN